MTYVYFGLSRFPEDIVLTASIDSESKRTNYSHFKASLIFIVRNYREYSLTKRPVDFNDHQSQGVTSTVAQKPRAYT